MKNAENNNTEYIQPLFEEESINFKRYISLFFSNWYWFAISLFLAFTLAYGINRYSQEVFSVSSSLLIKDETLGGYSGIQPIFPGSEIYKSQQNLKNEIGILRSFDLNREVIDSLPEFHTVYILIGRRGITEQIKYKDTPFIVTLDNYTGEKPKERFYIKIIDNRSFNIGIKGNSDSEREGHFGESFSSVDFNIKDRWFVFTVRLRDSANFVFNSSVSNHYNFYFPDLDNITNEYRGKLRITPVEEDASLVILSVSGPVPQKEIDYLNKLMQLYVNRGLIKKNKASEQTILFINNQLISIQDSLKAAEDSLQNFRLRNRLVDLSIEGSSIKSRLEKYESEKFSLIIQKRYFDYLINYLNSKDQTGDIVSPSIMDINDPVLERLILELSSLQSQKSQLGLNLSGNLPVISLIDEKIKTVRAALRENIDNSVRNLDMSVKEVDEKIRNIEVELARLPVTEKGLIRIQRKYELNNTVYNYLLEKRAEAAITKASNVPENEIIDNAGYYNITQVRPRSSRNNMIAFITGLIIPMLLILIIDYLNDKIIDRRDVERNTGAPILGYISHSDFKTELPVVKKPSSTLAESFRSVRTSLKFFTGDLSCPVISVTSTVVGEGKTFISVNLAAILAMLGKKVLLVGLDMRKPKIHRILNLDNENGLSRYLSMDADFEDIVEKTSIENFYFAKSGPVPPNPAELLDSSRIEEFFDEAKKRFDYIVLDTPPVAIVTDALLVSKYVDINIFVVRQRYTSKNTLGIIQELYVSRKLNNLCILINDISLTGYYGYGLRYGYTIRYGGYTYGYNLYGDYVLSKYGYTKDAKGYYVEDNED